MAKAKRMSDILASSAEQDVTMMSATPPYSSEGPTLPIIDAKGIPDVTTKITDRKNPVSSQGADKTGQKGVKGRGAPKTQNSSVAPTLATTHPTLYEPWRLLPPELISILETQSRLRGAENITPIVFTKNQNVKSGINRVKAYLGAYQDEKNPIDIPKSLNSKDSVITISAQGDGTAKLVSIVDMARRIVAPDSAEQDKKDQETWYMYLALTSIEVERKEVHAASKVQQTGKSTQDTSEEAFEPMDVDIPTADAKEQPKPKKTPVLTVWMTKRAIPAFKDAFGEQSFPVRKLPVDD